jgi:nucleoside-diphosphate-sugar epimerase
MRVLITGGAGVIGSHLTDLLLRNRWSVRVRDSLAPQVRSCERHRPPYLADDAEWAHKRYAKRNARQRTGGRIFAERSLV